MDIYSILIVISLTFSWILSPDSLVLQGNGAGLYGSSFYFVLAVGLFFATGCTFLLRHQKLGPFAGNTFSSLTETSGIFPASALIFASQTSMVLFLPTGILVTAGFTFNEIFLYWFPNFGFSFILLILILLLNLAGRKTALTMQPIFIGIAFSGLVILALFTPAENLIQQPVQTDLTLSAMASLPAGALLFFLGFDFSLSNGKNAPETPTAYVFFSSILCFILFVLWTKTSLDRVATERLASTAIPYLLVARETLGQTGRLIIGVTIISGTLGCVNGLFLQANNSLVELSTALFHRFSLSPFSRTRIYPVLFSICIGLFMMTGLAGSEKLETYIKGSLLLWLLLVITHCFAAASILRQKYKYLSTSGYCFGTILFISFCFVFASFQERVLLLEFCSIVLLSAALAAKGLLLPGNKHSINRPSI
jgi:hypothetical protein